ncbi:MAG: hypothetical protein H6830_02700 [Planctomycetes bacterium]|nr:hypothetical protein [Planctomycetota bacterium]MCB9910148.1 hypothetical protein [Planctomycetota bacterium]MCB9913085.1 hypothetical protein [Planctomycetota bacterium]HPF14146.1 hypothetical protein [Planctomycetota bacterium]HRV80697.1 hypothetical protein [Planctomycetota bacterium]
MSRCKHCGARTLPLQTVCDYCGTAYPTVGNADRESAPPRPAGPSPPRNKAEGGDWEMERLLSHPDLQQVIAEGPAFDVPVRRREGLPKGVLIFAFFALMAMTGSMRGVLRVGFPFPLAFVFLPVVFAVARRNSRDRSFPASPLEAVPARLMEVTEPWGRAQDPRPRAVLELASGRRRFLRLRRELIGELKPRDLGVAFIKADVLIDFRRLLL